MYWEVHDFNSRMHNVACFSVLSKLLDYITNDVPKSNSIKIRFVE